MEVIAEGAALVFLGILPLLVALTGDLTNPVSRLVFWASAGMLLVMALLSALTGARTAQIPFRICPFVKTGVALLFILGILL